MPRAQQYTEFIRDLESDLKVRMEKNWKMIFQVDRMVEERNMLHSKLLEIERILCRFPTSNFKQKVVDILL